MQALVVLLATILLVQAQGSYDPTVATNNLLLSFNAYCYPLSSTWYKEFTSINGAPFTVTASAYNVLLNVFAYVGYSGNNGYCIFRGTQPTSVTNWALDINTIPIPYPAGPGFVHPGFYSGWQALKGKVSTAITNLIQQRLITQMFFTGHSLGAAMTRLASLEVGITLQIPYYVYTFGEPRVGDQIFVTYWESLIPPSNSHRIVNEADVVPHLPPESFGYHHFATEVWYTNSTSYKVCDTSGEDPSCSNSVPLADIALFGALDHMSYLGQTLADQLVCLLL